MKNSRRSFIAKLGALSAGTGLISLAPGCANETQKQAVDLDDSPKTNFKLTIFQTTDVHCQIHPHDELYWENGESIFKKAGGYANLHTFIQQERAKVENSFLIDTGDMFQGSMLSVKTEGEAMVPILNAMSYDLYLPGNWEVVYYKKSMQDLLGSLNAPKVCANMYHDLGNGQKGELIFPPYYIWRVNGVKIGFLGYNDHLVPNRQSPNYSEGIIFTKPEDNVAHYVDVLKNQEKCAFVAIVSHIGLSQEIALANNPAAEGVDYILGADTHERVRKPIQGKYAKVVQPGAFGSFLGKLELTFEDGKVVKDEYELLDVLADEIKGSEKITNIIEQVEAPFKSDIEKVVGYSTIPLYRYFVIENPIDQMVLDALSWKIPDIDIVLSNGFRFCPPNTTPDETGNIPITRGNVYDMLPVDSIVRTGRVTGLQLMNWLEKELNNVFAEDASKRFGGWVIKFQGMEVEFYAFGDEGKRVKSVTVKGEPLELTKTYSISACERDGDPADVICRMNNVQNVVNKDLTLHQVMLEYLAENSPVTPTPKGAAKALDAPATLLTQVSGVEYQFR
ncbi:2',3'-cyclic-nucleotide 2'-phosphodiesterase/5'-or 3'-nucleotidase, 5'-nucleotidase family [Belliella buryatensis]|uniref:2',3'-cyclic-nucleotide 2'-phosphodiesterase/5'-or 3'-nucleotidase, 5'-nucleotidase family n=1 Tax=Belliella buryatensis TaxID=1500549 RepID=A0A239F0Y3_9BACT|nr:5'-nucleotidase C-terminal domain-containing protein [Belliella buryatensis]SNS49754.1 2',3'-cyclic-nucleotide 2'-phosphodiesterase/5'-or 3'-nucleotidase, 5'-nucleotidase family [Belliella buryatensis]